MKRSHLILLAIVVIACSKEDKDPRECFDYSPPSMEDCSTETHVEATTCIINEVISTNGGQRWVYHHDGMNYDQLDFFEQYDSEPTPIWTMEFEYDEQNRIAQVHQSNHLYGSTTEIQFNYDDKPYLVITYSVVDSDQNIVFNSSQEYPYYPLQKDSLYLFDYPPYFMMGFEEGNRTTFYQEDESSTCDIYNRRWILTSRNYYDQRPNVFSDYAVLQSSAFPDQIWYWGNANNLIGRIYPNDPEAELNMFCSEFLIDATGDYWIKSSFNRTYYYDCEN